ncbi:MAG: class I SAM-dependent methyltransferase [Syntrophobacterales bacterium]|nr:class I SAM-dependent methyltransferase [Syntrophobacterales bacterium]
MDRDCVLNSTKDYHVNSLTSLGWELTVCNALYPDETPLRKLLKVNQSYGNLLYDYLSRFVPFKEMRRVIEIGGGYGFLMKDFLTRDKSLNVCMLDISPFLLQKQRETLGGLHVSFRQEDFLETDPTSIAVFDLAIMNENLGDFPTLTRIRYDAMQSGMETDNPSLKKAIHFFERYRPDLPDREIFNLNIGAIEALEKICESMIPYIFLGEHSCEARSPEVLRTIIHVDPTGNPERIRLKGHDEYTIKFSYLEKVALAHGYKAMRGPFADFVTFNLTGKILSILKNPSVYGDEGEIICHFIEDLYKYEYLFLSRN